jgi:anti-sigma regulatory factor (Ser/Thr protein kinase)
MSVYSNENNLEVIADFGFEDQLRLLAAMHTIVEKQGYSDFVLDFSKCTKAFSAQMLPVCCRAQFYWKQGVDIKLRLPEQDDLRRLFLNTNWAHFIDFREFDLSRYRGYTHSPALRFSNGSEQHKVVDKTMDVLLAAIKQFKRDDIRYIEWAINEITDNVINHAESSVGGFIQVTNHRHREQIEIVVCDGGIGIPATLSSSFPGFTDSEMLYEAIKEGVTRDKSFGQGNGLYGSLTIAGKSGGELNIASGYASLRSSSRTGLTSERKTIPVNGTVVASRFGYGDKFDLSDALVISGRTFVPVDYIETHFESDAEGNILFLVKNESDGFGSRAAGEPVRRKLGNVINAQEGDGVVTLDFSDVPLVSSSYADEVVGKLFVELGPLEFMRRIRFSNVDPLVKGLVDKAVMQRSAS